MSDPANSSSPDPLARQRQLVLTHPQNQLARFSLGKALFDRGQFAEAHEHLKLALARQPEWMAVQILVGRCELALGEVPAARASFTRALELARAQRHEGPEAEMEQLLSELQ